MQPQLTPVCNTSDHARDITKRFVLYVGFKCNMRCQFCYYLKSIEDGTAKMDDFEGIKKKILLARRLGKSEIDLTGGEATIHPKFLDILRLCKSEGFSTINVITNGLAMSRFEFARRAAEAGLTEVLFSLHSSNAEEHDALTQVPKSQKRILESIGHAQTLGLKVRINTVVNSVNYGRVDEHLQFLQTLRPASVNLIVFNPSEETPGYSGHDAVRLKTYEPIAASIKSAVEKHKNNFPVINIRFLPFCYAKGLEPHIRTYWQEIYEKEEWDPLLHWSFRKNWAFSLGAAAVGLGIAMFKTSMTRFGRKNIYTRVAEWMQLARVTYLFRHKKECGSCAMRLVCPGLPREYSKAQPNASVYPYDEKELPLIVNPVAFGYLYPAKFPSLGQLERVGPMSESA